MNVLVLGSKGFIGAHFLKSKLGLNFFGLDKIDIDLTEEQASNHLTEFITKFNINVVILLSAIKRQDGDSKTINSINNLIVRNAIDGISQSQATLVYFSSCAVFGEKNNQTNIHENSPLSPTSFYGEHKITAEHLIREILPQESYLVLRPPLIYSISQTIGYHPGGFIASAETSGTIQLWGDGEEIREMVDVSDSVNITINLLTNHARGVYNMVSGSSYSYIDCANCIRKYLLDTEIMHKSRTAGKVDHSYNNSKLLSKINSYRFLSPFESISKYFESK